MILNIDDVKFTQEELQIVWEHSITGLDNIDITNDAVTCNAVFKFLLINQDSILYSNKIPATITKQVAKAKYMGYKQDEMKSLHFYKPYSTKRIKESPFQLLKAIRDMYDKGYTGGLFD